MLDYYVVGGDVMPRQFPKSVVTFRIHDLRAHRHRQNTHLTLTEHLKSCHREPFENIPFIQEDVFEVMGNFGCLV